MTLEGSFGEDPCARMTLVSFSESRKGTCDLSDDSGLRTGPLGDTETPVVGDASGAEGQVAVETTQI